MDFKQIEAFINVAKHKSFSKAAEAIFLSQPTISSHISSLEKELKVILFDRNGKDIRLTEAGKIFYEYAVNLLNIRNTAVSDLSKYDDSISGQISIAASTTPCRYLLPYIIKSFHDKYSDITFDVKEGSSLDVINALLNFNADFGIVGEIIEDCKLNYTKLFDDRLILISNIDGLNEKLTLDEVINLPFIQREDGSATRHIFEKFLEKNYIDTNSISNIITANSLESLLIFVKNGLGVAVVSEYACKEYLECGIIKKHTVKGFDIVRGIYLVCHNKKTLTPAAREMINHIKANYINFV